MKSAGPAKDSHIKKNTSAIKTKNSRGAVNKSRDSSGQLNRAINNLSSLKGQPGISETVFNVDAAERDFVLLNLQRTHGNQYVQKMAGIQAKLKISEPGDIYEQEADRVAESIMHVHNSSTLHKLTIPCTNTTECNKKNKNILKNPIKITPLVQRQVADSDTNNAFEFDISSIENNGHRLSDSVRSYFEFYLGHDFSDVKIHTNSRAAGLANAMNAQAFTIGQNIVFKEGNYVPNTIYGKTLIGHELTHVIQQSQSNELLRNSNRIQAYIAGYQYAKNFFIQRQAITEEKISEKTAPTVSIKAQTNFKLPTLEQAAHDLTRALAMPNPDAHKEEIFRTLLLFHSQADELKSEFQRIRGRELITALKKELSNNDIVLFADKLLDYGYLNKNRIQLSEWLRVNRLKSIILYFIVIYECLKYYNDLKRVNLVFHTTWTFLLNNKKYDLLTDFRFSSKLFTGILNLFFEVVEIRYYELETIEIVKSHFEGISDSQIRKYIQKYGCRPRYILEAINDNLITSKASHSNIKAVKPVCKPR